MATKKKAVKKKKAAPKKKKTVNRSSRTGKFVTKKYTRANPDTTETEIIK